jgi:hypothetical protein
MMGGVFVRYLGVLWQWYGDAFWTFARVQITLKAVPGSF